MNEKQAKSSNFIVIFVVISSILIILEHIISLKFPSINYYDDLFSLVIFMVFLFSCHGVVKRNMFAIILCLTVILILGYMGNLFSKINLNFFILSVDALGVIKIFLAMIGIKELAVGVSKRKIIYFLSLFTSIFVFIAFFTYFIAYSMGNLTLFSEVRFGIKSYSFIMDNPGELGYLLMGMFLILMLDNKKRTIVKLMTFFLILTTTKGPQILFVIMFIVLKLFWGKRKINIVHVALLGIIILIVGQYQIHNYLLNSTSARYLLNITSLKIANHYFPFGSGLATFGSEMSRQYYSPLYFEYNLSSVWGLSRQYSEFINDNYWAMVVGQFGYFGCSLMMYVLYKIFSMINGNVNNGSLSQRCTAMSLFLSFLIGSIGSAYLTSSAGVLCFIALGLYFSADNNYHY